MHNKNLLIVHVPNNTNNNNGEFHLVRDGALLLQGIFNTSFLDGNADQLDLITDDILNTLPESVKHDIQDGSTYIFKVAKEVKEAVQAVSNAVKNPNIVTKVIAAKESIDAVVSVVKAVKAVKKAKASKKK